MRVNDREREREGEREREAKLCPEGHWSSDTFLLISEMALVRQGH